MSSRPRSRLQEVREARDLSRRQVAAIIGSSEKQLERWEKGKTPVKHWHLVALAAVYDVEVAELDEGVAA